MEGKVIKREFSYYVQMQCRVCLSVGRKLFQLGQYADIYKNLTSDILTRKIDFEAIEVCWECLSILQKVVQFQNHVQKADVVLQQGQSLIYGTLSNLTTVIINDTHPSTIYLSETNIQTDIKPVYVHQPHVEIAESKTTDLETNHYSDDYLNDSGHVEVKKESVIKKKKHENKWAKRWAIQNKKPKFKIITKKELNFDENFTKIQIDDNELRKCLERERDSEYFKSKWYKCDECIVGYNDESIFIKHYNDCHDKTRGDYICNICKTRFSEKRHLSKHINKHYYIYKCKICGFTCQHVHERSWHYKKEHRKVFQCLKCELKFGGRREFFKHFKEWHEKFICDYCGISFKMRYCIKDHIRKQHSPFECKQCDKRFARYNGLWLHNKIRHGPPTAAAYCVECDKRYVDVYRYRWHLANSARHKPRKRVSVPCPGCDKYFSKKIYMKDHYNLVHLKFYRYRCEECDKNFTRNADLVKHNRRVHEGILPPKNKICYMCGRGFSTNKILTNHLRTHTGERPHACSACDARFAQSTALHAHVRALHDKHAKNT